MQNLCGIDERYCPLKWRAVLFSPVKFNYFYAKEHHAPL